MYPFAFATFFLINTPFNHFNRLLLPNTKYNTLNTEPFIHSQTLLFKIKLNYLFFFIMLFNFILSPSNYPRECVSI